MHGLDPEAPLSSKMNFNAFSSPNKPANLPKEVQRLVCCQIQNSRCFAKLLIDGMMLHKPPAYAAPVEQEFQRWYLSKRQHTRCNTLRMTLDKKRIASEGAATANAKRESGASKKNAHQFAHNGSYAAIYPMHDSRPNETNTEPTQLTMSEKLRQLFEAPVDAPSLSALCTSPELGPAIEHKLVLGLSSVRLRRPLRSQSKLGRCSVRHRSGRYSHLARGTPRALSSHQAQLVIRLLIR